MPQYENLNIYAALCASFAIDYLCIRVAVSKGKLYIYVALCCRLYLCGTFLWVTFVFKQHFLTDYFCIGAALYDRLPLLSTESSLISVHGIFSASIYFFLLVLSTNSSVTSVHCILSGSSVFSLVSVVYCFFSY